MKNKYYSLISLGVLTAVASGVFVFATPHIALAVSAPTIRTPKNGAVVAPDTKIVVTGLAQNNSTIYFILDKKVIGGTKVKNGKNNLGSFSFTIKQTLSRGVKHSLESQALNKGAKSPFSSPITFTLPKTWPRRLDGVIVDASKANVLPVAVMIENLAQVRPQSGLASASIVYEALAEGGIPRFMAIFARDDMLKVGPVRSTRPYYVDIAKEYGGPLLHAGGSRDAFQEIGRLQVRSIDALVNKTAKYFFRTGTSPSTHNLFTNKTRIAAIKNDFKLESVIAGFDPWKFKDDPVLSKRPNEKRQLTIDFKSGREYIVMYKYERASNSYLRFNGGRPHLDANYPKATQIKVKNVVVQLIEKEKVLDAKKHLALQITGSGKGWLLQDGKLQQIIWRKAKANSRTKFYFTNGKEIEFDRGNTWVEIVPKDRPVTYK